MIASLQKNALPLALVLLCAAAMYMVYRDMRRMETRMAQLNAVVESLSDRCGDDEDVFNMLDEVCPLPVSRPQTIVEEHEAPAAVDAAVVEAPDVSEAPADEDDMEAEILDAVKQAIAAA